MVDQTSLWCAGTNMGADVMIPSWKSQKENATLADHWMAFRQSQRNWFWNIRSCVIFNMSLSVWSLIPLFCSLYLMAKANSIPGVKVKSAWSKQLFSASSTKPDTWLAPFCQAALEVYKQVNEAVAA